MDFNNFKIIQKEIEKKLNEKYNLIYININKINSKIKYSKRIIFLINEDINEIKNIMKKINFIKKKYYINNEKINILINKNNKNSINKKILKNIFNDYNFLGKTERSHKWKLH